MVARKRSKLYMVGPLTLGFALGAVVAAITFFSLFNSYDEAENSNRLFSDSNSGQTPDSQGSNIGNDLQSLSNEVGLASLSEVAQLSSEFERSAALFNILLQADKRDLLTLVDQSKKVSPATVQRSMQQSIFQRLASIDSVEALKQAKTLPKHRQDPLVQAIFEEWSITDLDESVKVAKNLDGPQKIAALQGILRSRTDLSESLRKEIARDFGRERVAVDMISQARMMELLDNPEEAWFAMIGDQNQRSSQTGILIQIGNAWVRQQGLGVLGQIAESFTDWQTRSTVVRSIIAKATLANPQDALNQALRLRSNQVGEWAPMVVREWALSEPRTAFDAATNVSPSGLRRSLQESVVIAWATNNPNMLLEELALLPENLQNLAREQAILAIARNEPLEAVDLMASVEDDSSRHMIAYSVASSWSDIDPVAAVNWILSNPDLERMRNELLTIVFQKLALENPQLAMELALKQPIEHGRGLEAIVIARLAQVDLQHALALLAQVREGQTQVAAFMSIGQQLVRNYDTDRALKLGEQLDGQSRSSYYQSVMSTWANMDPEGLVNSLDKLPSTETKSKAALSLARSNQYREVLTTDQLDYAKSFLSEQDAKRLDSGIYHSFGWSPSGGSVFVTADVAADSVVSPEVIVGESLVRYELQSRLEEEDSEDEE